MNNEAGRILHKAKMYENMVWLGLLFYPCAIVFAILATSTAGTVQFEKHNEYQERLRRSIKGSCVLAVIIITLIWLVFGSVFFVSFIG